ncbi:MAG: DUF1800 domain-containing protein [Saprospiraceae bacterium]|jgi:uncharacterized protein (DUF1800 family)|nr:DUF1800 domain-containing protein [Saprospiraceae bacterium]
MIYNISIFNTKFSVRVAPEIQKGGITFMLITALTALQGQQYKDYIGAGHNVGVKITASSQSNGTTAAKTMDASGLEAKILDASRFLGQATFGATNGLIDSVASMGYEAWIDNQFTKPPQRILPELTNIWRQIHSLDSTAFGPYSLHFNYAWWQTNMTNQDLLRQKVAYALSQILVTSINSELGTWGESVASYYDIFINHAFGNYKDILLAVTKHPAMGYYLSHLNNHPEDPANNIHPDENFAREIMQLFTIGLYQLRQDGTRMLDGNGKPIPTYNNNDIKQLARVFTGLGGSQVLNMMFCPTQPEFGTDMYCLEKTSPMRMFGWAHQSGSKSFLGHNIAGSSSYTDATAMAEVDNAVTFLFNHPNTAPFVSYRLIQRLVKSNPSPAYIGRVSAIFANNGTGVRGDMKAILKAILLDPEASSLSAYSVPYASKLREPFTRYTHISRAFQTQSDKNRYWNNGFSYLNETRQHVMASPTVFNFYLPDFEPVGEMDELNLVAPEFKLHNTATAVGYINSVHAWMFWNSLMYSWEGSDENPDGVRLVTNDLQAICDDTEVLINRLDKLLTHGQLTDQTRQLMRNALNPMYWTWDTEWRYWRTRLALYLFMISPDYNCVK